MILFRNITLYKNTKYYYSNYSKKPCRALVSLKDLAIWKAIEQKILREHYLNTQCYFEIETVTRRNIKIIDVLLKIITSKNVLSETELNINDLLRYDKNKFPLSKKEKMLLKKIFREFTKIQKFIKKCIEKNKLITGMNKTHDKIKRIFKVINKMFTKHKFSWLSQMIYLINTILVEIMFHINDMNNLQNIDNHILKLLTKDLMLKLIDKITFAEKDIMGYIGEEIIRNNLFTRLSDVKDKLFVSYLHKIIKNLILSKQTPTLISMMFNDENKIDFYHLTVEEKHNFITFIQNRLMKNNSENNIIKIVLDPTKGLWTLYYYCTLEEKSLQDKLYIIKKIIAEFRIFLRNTNPIKYTMKNIEDFSMVNKYGSFILTKIQEIFCHDNFNNADFDYNEFAQLYRISMLNFTRDLDLTTSLDNALLYHNPMLKLFKELYSNEVKGIPLFSRQYLYNLGLYFCKYIHIFYTKPLDDLENIINDFAYSYYVKYNVNNINNNLISLLFVNRELWHIKQLSQKQRRLLWEFLQQLLVMEHAYEDFCAKFALDVSSGGFSLISFYVYNKKIGQNLTKKEFFDLKKSMIKFQYDNNILLKHDFAKKDKRFIKYCESLVNKTNNKNNYKEIYIENYVDKLFLSK